MADRIVRIEMPEAAYDLMMETLSMDLESSMIDSSIRQELEKALNHMVVETVEVDADGEELVDPCAECGHDYFECTCYDEDDEVVICPECNNPLDAGNCCIES